MSAARSLLLVLALGACASDQQAHRAATGGLIGAGGGAAIGAVVGGVTGAALKQRPIEWNRCAVPPIGLSCSSIYVF